MNKISVIYIQKSDNDEYLMIILMPHYISYL